MKVLRYENSVDNATDAIFLAGPTVRGNQTHLTSWRFEAIELFEKKGFDGTLIVPEFVSRTESDKGKDWLPKWEFKGLQLATIIMFWVPRTRELIGLTTNHELGYWLGRDRHKIVYGRPNDAYRIDYLDIMWKIDAKARHKVCRPIYTTLASTIKASLARFKVRKEWLEEQEKDRLDIMGHE